MSAEEDNLTEFGLEIEKLLKKPRTYIGPVAMLGLIGIVLVAMRYGNEFQHMYERLAQDFIISGSFVNAAFLTRYMLLPPVLYMFLPLFSCTVFGDLIASEAADGTLRTLLCRPVTRWRVIGSKYAVGVLYVFVLTMGTGLLAYLLGWAFLGRGSLLSFAEGLWILPERMAVIRLVEIYALVAAGMAAVGSMAFAISTFLNNSNGAIAGAVGFLIVSGIVGQIEFFSRLRPYLLTTYLEVDGFFKYQLDLPLFLKSLGVMLAYAVVSFLIGVVVFHRRDVLA